MKKINIGGHLEDLSFKEGIEYLNNVRNIVPENIIMIAELGDFLFKNVGTLYCNVVDVRYDSKVQVVTLNFSKWQIKDGHIQNIFQIIQKKVTLKLYFMVVLVARLIHI